MKKETEGGVWEGVERMLLGVGTFGLWTIIDILVDLYRDWRPKQQDHGRLDEAGAAGRREGLPR